MSINDKLITTLPAPYLLGHSGLINQILKQSLVSALNLTINYGFTDIPEAAATAELGLSSPLLLPPSSMEDSGG